MTPEAKKEKDILEITNGENANLAGMEPRCPKCGKPEEFFQKYVAEKTVHLSGVDWQMVVSTMEESADNCHRCERKGCAVCRMTRQIAKNIEGQL